MPDKWKEEEEEEEATGKSNKWSREQGQHRGGSRVSRKLFDSYLRRCFRFRADSLHTVLFPVCFHC